MPDDDPSDQIPPRRRRRGRPTTPAVTSAAAGQVGGGAKISRAADYLDLSAALTHTDLMLIEAAEREQLDQAQLDHLSQQIAALAARVRTARTRHLHTHPQLEPDEE